MRRFLLRCVLIALLGLIAPKAVVAGVDQTEFSVRVETPAFEYTSTGVSVPGYVLNDIPGSPQLPVYGAVLELPGTGDWQLDFVSNESTVLPRQLAVTAVPVPVPSRSGSVEDPEATIFSLIDTIDRPDPAIYNNDAFYPAAPVVAGAEQWQRGKRLLAIRFFPFQYNPVRRELYYHPDLTAVVRLLPQAAASPAVRQPEPEPLSVTAELGALRIRTSQQGMHRLTYNDLAPRVPLSNVDPASFAMTYLGQSIQIRVIGAEDGSFDDGDLVVFYAEPYLGRWMPSNVYRFSWGDSPADPATRMATRSIEPTGLEPVITEVTQTLRINVDKVYQYSYWIDTEADHFTDTALSASSGTRVITRTYSLALDDAITSAGDLSVHGLIYGAYTTEYPPVSLYHWAKLRLNDHDLGTYLWDGQKPYTITQTTPPVSYLDEPTNQLHLVADYNQVPGIGLPAETLQISPDFFEISYRATADAELDRIEVQEFESSETSARLRVTGFTTEMVTAYDVRNPRSPVELLATTAEQLGGSYRIEVLDAWNAGDPDPAYWLSTNLALFAPTAIEVDQPTSWKSPDHEADYIAIVHSSFWDAIQPLLDRRSDEGFRIAKVNIQDIYDEFNHGHLHQEAIRSFLKYAYDHWNPGGEPPKYVLLVGDATPDYKGVTATTLKNLVPAFFINIDPYIVETAADNRYVSLDGPNDYLPDMTIARISAQNPTEVTNFYDKVVSYEDKAVTPDGPWQDRVVYAADNKDDPAGNFHVLSDDARLNWLPSYYTSRTVYYRSNASLDTDGEMRTAIKAEFNNGAIFMQWFGHASRFRWGSRSFWNINDVPTLDANTMLPFVVAYSCWDGYFHNMDTNYPALAERHLLQQGRGSIGSLSPSGKHVGSALAILDRGLTKSFFQDRVARNGDAVDAARLYYFANSSSFHDVIDTSILFGDPVLKIRLPLPQPMPPEVGIEYGSATTVKLGWGHLEPDTTYQVWRGSLPYFDPDTEGAEVGQVDASLGGYVAGESVSYIDDGTQPPPAVTLVGDVVNNYFWVIRGANWRGVSDDSNRVGEFDFALVKGQ